jgi:long-chain fatty acid transport protein
MRARTTVTAAALALALALAATLSAPSRRALAAGIAAARFGGEHGHITATNATALYFNPAGIAFAARPALYADGLLVLRSATWEHQPAPTDRPDPPGAEGANAGRATLFNGLAAPMLGGSGRLGPLALGAALFVPFGGRARWDENPRFAGDPSFPLAAGGVQRWHAIEGSLTSIYLALGAAYRRGRVAVGLAGNLIRSDVRITQAQNPTGSGDPDTAREGRAALDVSGYQGSFGAGVMVEAVEDRLWLGLGYQAQPGLGPMALDGTLVSDYAGGRTELPVTLHQALPDSLRLGLRFRPAPGYELRLAGELVRWSVMRTQCVGIRSQPCAVDQTGADATPEASTVRNLRRYWRDTAAIRAGASRSLGARVELFAGAGFETAAIPDRTLDPGLADAHNVMAALGGRFGLSPGLFVAASYTHIQYLERDNTGRSELAAAVPPSRRPDGGGRYRQWIGLLNVNLEKHF